MHFFCIRRLALTVASKQASGMNLLITAGPTREALDPVRYLSNRSSGRMGFALAGAAAEAGHRVTLIAGPVTLATPPRVAQIDVVTAQEMYEAVAREIGSAEAAVFAAAVADYRPVSTAAQKIKKGEPRLTLELERTPDILGAVRPVFGWRGLLVGFAAETENLEDYAREKLERKGCDLIIANDVSRPGIGFDSPDNEVTILFRGGRTLKLPQMPKVELAGRIVGLIEHEHMRSLTDRQA